MMKRRSIVTILCLALAMLMVVSACGGSSSTTDTGKTGNNGAVDSSPLGKYNPPITLTMFKNIEPGRTYMPGETWDNNIWTKAYSEKLGINFKYLWTASGDEYNSKVNIAIASDELPDLMTLNYDQFYMLAKAGRLADISDAYKNYAGNRLKTNFEFADSEGIKMDSVNGKLYGYGGPPDYVSSPYMLWYRDDWMKNLGLQAPKTFDDVLNMATAFAKNDPNKNGSPTVGFGIAKGLWKSGMDLAGFFNAYHQYVDIWVDNNGKLEYGSIQPGCKTVLTKLNELYKQGVIDKEFSLKDDWTLAKDDVIKDKIGMVFGPVWFGDWIGADLMKKHPKTATWSVMSIPSTDGNPTLAEVNGKQANVACMSLNTAHPEAMIKILNLQNALMKDEGTAEGKYHDQKDPKGNIVNNFFHQIINISDDPMWNPHCSDMVIDALKSGDTSKLNDEMKSYYNRSKAYLDGTDMTGYASYLTFAENGGMQADMKNYNNKLYMADKYTGPNTETMTSKWSNLKSKRDEYFAKFIMGTSPISDFDKWVQYFNSQGGEKITQEVNDWYAAQPKN